MGSVTFGERVWNRIDDLAARFVQSVLGRLERREQVLGQDITPAIVDEVVGNWLGAAAEELLNGEERTKSPG